jgi:hypothetical protein
MSLDQGATFNIEGYVVKRIASGESGAAVFEEGEAYKILA